MKQEPTVDQWMETQSQGSGVTTEQLDEQAKLYQVKYAEYEKQKMISTKLYEEANELERELIAMLEQAGKQRYHVDGLGLFFFVDKLVVRTPKSIEDKKKLFTHLRNKYGEKVYLDKISINHQTLQSLYNTLFTEHVDSGQEGDFHLPGLEAPTNMRSLNFRKERK